MEPINLTSAERHIMECLWEAAPQTGRKLSEKMEVRMGWSRSTTLTLLRRLVDKGIVLCGGDKKCLFPRCTEGGCGPAGNAEPFGPGLSGKAEHAGKHHDAKEGRFQRET